MKADFFRCLIGISRILSIVLAALCLGTGAFAKAPEDGKFTPVIVISKRGANASEGAINEDIHRQIVETISEQMRHAVLTVYSEEIYGTGAAFKKRAFRSGPLGIMGRAFQQFDQGLQIDVRSGKLGNLLRQNNGANQNYSVEVFWAKAPNGLPTVGDKVGGASAMAILWNMSKAAAKPEDVATADSVVNGLSNIAVINAKDIPGGIVTLYEQGRQVYDWLAPENQRSFLPMYASFDVRVGQGQIGVDLTIQMKPGDLLLPLDPPEPDDVILSTNLVFQPPHFVEDPTVGRLSFHRNYSTDLVEKPYLTMSFGRLFGNDVRNMSECSMACAELDANGGAKHIQRSAPTVPGKIRIPSTLTGIVGKGVSRIAGYAVDMSRDSVDLFVMLQEVTFDLSDPSGPKVVPEKSRVPLILRTTDPLGNQRFVDITQNRYGVDIIQKMVANSAANELTESVRSDIQAADGNGKKKFGEMTELLKTTFR